MPDLFDEACGRGAATRFDVLTITDGMTVGELVDRLHEMPRDGKFVIKDGVEIVPRETMRFPIMLNYYKGV